MSARGSNPSSTIRISAGISCEVPLFAHLKRLTKDTAIYGTSTVVSRFLTFLLVPFYTHVLVPSEYGIVALVYTYLAFVTIVYRYGMEASYFRYAAGETERVDRHLFSTPFLSLVATSTVISCVVIAVPEQFAVWIDPHGSVPIATMNTIVRLAGVIVFFDTLCSLPYAALRLQHRAVSFAAISVANVSLQVGLNVLFLVVLHWGVVGIFVGNGIASVLTLALLTPTISRLFAPAFSREVWRRMFAFGLPYVPSALSAMMLQVIDRPILQRMTDDAHVGVYQANYRLGIAMMVFVSMFEYAWRPFFLQFASAPDAKAVFARVLTYFTAAAAVLFLVVSFFIEPIAHLHLFGRTLIQDRYWSGLGIVPIVLAAYVFNGWYTNMIAGVYIKEKTRHLPWITGAGALCNIVANLILIPPYGIVGAAWATFIAYGLMAALLFLTTRRYYPVPYEWGRIGAIVAATVAAFGAEVLLHGMLTGAPLMTARVGLLLVFGASFFAMRFFSPDERALMRRLVARMRG